MNDRMIKVWQFEDAPKELQDLSTNGGDEDWVIVVPKCLKDANIWISWVDYLNRYDMVQKRVLNNGDVVYIASH